MKFNCFAKSALLLVITVMGSLCSFSQVIVPYGSSWKYWDQNTRPVNWQTSAFDDALWASGPAELGYSNENEEVTVISYGGVPTNKNRTAYFRKSVTIANPAAFSSFTFNVERDDGFVLYVNGTEVSRHNMPSGAPDHSTFAVWVTDDSVVNFTVPSSAFIAGNNVLAVEMHQINAGSSDLSFNLQMAVGPATTTFITNSAIWKYFDNGTRPANWQTTAFNDAAWASGPAKLGYGDPVATTIFMPASTLRYSAYFRHTVNIPNPATFQNFTINLVRDDGAIVYINGVEVFKSNMTSAVPTHTLLAASTIGGTAETAVNSYTVASSYFVNGNNTIAVEVHQDANTSSDLTFQLELIGNGTAPASAVLMNSSDVWKFLDNGTNQGTNWQTTSFDDATWKSGHAKLGYGESNEATVVSFGPNSNAKYITTYFRRTLNLPDLSGYQSINLSVIRDDGIIIYINGVEVARDNMPSGEATYTTVALAAIGDAAETTPVVFSIPLDYFVEGLNTIAVEIHQNAGNSSDLSFSMQMTTVPSVATTNFISNSADWKYLDNNTRPVGWETTVFDDAAWASGPAKLGYGDAPATTVGFGPDANNKYITTYFRKTVIIPNPSSFENFTINLIRDDGAIVYINGVEVFKSNMTPATPTHNLLAFSNIGGAEETDDTSYTVATSYFVNGTNTIAVEIHQELVTSTDLSFQLELIGNGTAPTSPVFMNTNDIWKFLDNGTNQGTDWQSTEFDDAGWKSGHAKLGFSPNGEDNEVTLVEFGPDPENKYITTYFRRTFNLPNLSSYPSITLNVVRDDGVVIYVNGIEVSRDNMPPGEINFLTEAPNIISDAGETTPVVFSINSNYFNEGLNTIAVEVHQRPGGVSTDLSFSMQVLGSTTPVGSSTITRGPYLQMGSETAINLRWRTSTATDSRVELGTTFGTYTIMVDSVNSVTDHEVRVTGLSPDTKYYYRVGTTLGYLQGGVNNFFTTAPPANTTRKIRIAAFGDCGNNSLNNRTNSLAQYQNYITANGIDAADAWLLLGDNSYDGVTDADYTSDFFGPYATNLLLNHKLYPSPGNHDYGNLSRTSRTIPYYQVFSLPKAGELGGIPSGSEAFYSFDIGNVHFLSLDSHGEQADGPNTRIYDTLGSQVQWVKQDLAANTKKWVIAYWHHPPYTKGSHNSDTEGELVNIRTNFIKILERYGVDLIICGHSHVYERSKLIQGHYGNEASYSDGAFAKNASSGKYIDNTSCPYITQTGTQNHGTVYVVSGSAGSSSGGVQAGFPHNATPYAFDEGGMFYIEVEDNRLDGKFIRANPDGSNPLIADQFTIFQNVDTAFTYSIASGNPITLTASWPGNHNWSTTATTRAITVTPPEGTTNYTVTDNFNCITDQFTVHANVCTSEINTWVGNKSSAWEDGLNWSCGVVPGPTSEVVIKVGTPHQATVNSNVTIKKLTLQTGANVVVNTGFTLDVTGQ